MAEKNQESIGTPGAKARGHQDRRTTTKRQADIDGVRTLGGVKSPGGRNIELGSIKGNQQKAYKRRG